jgi:hypothetical protein
MRLLDEQYTKVSFYGVRRLTAWLRARGYIVNPKRVRVLMRRMGLQGIFFNNAERLPQGLGYHMPDEVYFGHTASEKSVEVGNLNG